MGYYQGDYYRGDYYGDPFLGGLIKKIGGVVGGVAKGFLGGGPVGAISGGIRGVSQSFGGRPPLATSFAGPMPVLRTPGLKGIGQRLIPGGATGYEVALPGGGDGCPKGHHRNKSDYFLKSGQFVQAGTACVKNRRMNVTNPRALRKAIRRNRGFVKTFRKAASSVGMVTYAKRAPRMRKSR